MPKPPSYQYLLEENHGMRNNIRRLEAEMSQYAQGPFYGLTSTPCCKCGGSVVEFSIPNSAWNTIIRGDGGETDQEYLCLTCFAEIAAKKIERQNILCRSLVGEELLHRDGQYETEMQRLTAEVKALREIISGALAHSYGPYSDKELLRRVVKILTKAADAAEGKSE